MKRRQRREWEARRWGLFFFNFYILCISYSLIKSSLTIQKHGTILVDLQNILVLTIQKVERDIYYIKIKCLNGGLL